MNRFLDNMALIILATVFLSAGYFACYLVYKLCLMDSRFVYAGTGTLVLFYLLLWSVNRLEEAEKSKNICKVNCKD